MHMDHLQPHGYHANEELCDREHREIAMSYWSLIARRNIRAKPIIAAAVTFAVAIGVGTIVWLTSAYETVQRSITDEIVNHWVGKSHIAVQSPLGHWGQIPEQVVDVLDAMPEVTAVAPRLVRRMSLVIDGGRTLEGADRFIVSDDRVSIDVIGVEPNAEFDFRSYDHHGELLSDDQGSAMLDSELADGLGVGPGDVVTVEFYVGGPKVQLIISGTFEAYRVAKFQKPTVLMNLPELQTMTREVGTISSVDAMLVDPDPDAIEPLADRLRGELQQKGLAGQVTTATAKLRQLNEAQRHTEFVLIYVAGVALLTAFYIIMTTLNMGMTERIRQMGMMRCVGMTRSQLTRTVLGEVIPLGIAGLLVGPPLGLLLTWLTTKVASEYFTTWHVSQRGIAYAIAAGIITTVLAALLPAIKASRVTPLSATRPQASPPKDRWTILAALFGAASIAGHIWMVNNVDPALWANPYVTVISDLSIYAGFGLLAPLTVRLLGTILAHVAARLLGLRPVLLNDHIGRAAWRGAAICCGLMAGLSMLVGLVVHAESVRAGWDFPNRLAEAFIWTRTPVSYATAEQIREMDGIKDCTLISDFLVDLGDDKPGLFKIFDAKSTFVAGEPEVFLRMAKLEFLEGDLETAKAKLIDGGHLLVPVEASRTHDLHLGDKVSITAAGRTAEFTVAGVVQSPALDIAVTYFQADSYMMVAASGSVLGTLADVRRVFGVDRVSMLLIDFELPTAPPPDIFTRDEPPTVDDTLVANLVDKHASLFAGFDQSIIRSAMRDVVDDWDNADAVGRWRMLFDQARMRTIAMTMGRPRAIYGSLRLLKERIDNDIQEATSLLAAIPLVALLVAGIGVGNLMMSNVINRQRELAVLRATGATQGQIMRLVLGEAIVLGVIGCLIGLGLGLQGAHSMNVLTTRLIGFAPEYSLPIREILAGVSVTVLICVLAGLWPARRACRINVIDAMRTV